MAESGKKHPIRIVARRTGTPETTLRAWERRYGAVRPERAETGRRLYSDADIDRLRLMRQAVDAGRQISTVAGMSNDDLARLVEEDRGFAETPGQAAGTNHSTAEIVAGCLPAVAAMDAPALQARLNQAMLRLPAVSLIDDVIAPLLHRIGRQWEEGRLSPRHEHLASSVVRTILTQLQAAVQHAAAGTIVIGTPPNQLHDLGTQFVAALAISEGWNAVNLGADIPASDIVAAAHEVGADVVALSVIHPSGDSRIEEELAYISEHLGDDVRLIVGGQGAESYRSAIERARGSVILSARDFVECLG